MILETGTREEFKQIALTVCSRLPQPGELYERRWPGVLMTQKTIYKVQSVYDNRVLFEARTEGRNRLKDRPTTVWHTMVTDTWLYLSKNGELTFIGFYDPEKGFYDP